MGMRLTEEQVLQDNMRFANCNALTELKYCGWDIPHRKSITNDEIRFYAWLCRSAVSMLKEQEAVVRCKDCKHGQLINGEIWCLTYVPNTLVPPEWFCADGERR